MIGTLWRIQHPSFFKLTKINPFQNYIYFLSSKRCVRNGDENFTHK